MQDRWGRLPDDPTRCLTRRKDPSLPGYHTPSRNGWNSTSNKDLPMKNTSFFRRASRAGVLIAAMASLGACGPLHRGNGPTQTATVIFSNESIDQADVYAVVSGSQAVRIGTVFAGRTESLRVPSD